jgi:hypothetical protein
MAKYTTENLPALEGSEKQIAWAEEIRAELIIGINELVETAAQNTVGTDAQKKQLYDACDYIANQAKASYWILEHKDHKNRLLARMIVCDRIKSQMAK